LDEISEYLNEKAGVKLSTTTLGHIQRGGSPTMQDRILASKFGERAIELIMLGAADRVIGIRDNKIIDENISEALEMERKFDKKLYKLAEIMSL
ncbi:MAG: 6-phosphofructokinase, partial [Clostridia bacterium]|nr:6-phosphofructokinase [Clostridia bacterium]